jgi:phenylalanyl-tRNA synthetase beta chain
MRVHSEWMREWVAGTPKATELAALLTSIGFEIETVETSRRSLEAVRFGTVTATAAHPKTEGQTVLTVVVGDAHYSIVTAMQPSPQTGDVVPVALPGTTLFGGVAIGESKLGGVPSQGMVVALYELGLLMSEHPGTPAVGVPDRHGALYLAGAEWAGRALIEHPWFAAKADDGVLDVSILANRPDCMGLRGLAREISLATGTALTLPPHTAPAPVARCPVSVAIEAPALCSRYAGQFVGTVTIGPSPAWVQGRLLVAGYRPISNAVDVTNLVQYEFGQPMHAFDAATLTGNAVRVRTAAPGEALTLLDGTNVTLPPTALVIADAEKPRALAGIMGGVDSGVTAATATVFLESAQFEAVGVRRTSKALGIRSDSSSRFERGVDPGDNVRDALGRAGALLAGFAGAGQFSEVVETFGHKAAQATVTVRPSFVNATLGLAGELAISADALATVFDGRSIGYDRQPENSGAGQGDDLFTVTQPTWRTDLTHPVVVVEDVARQLGRTEKGGAGPFGLDRIPETKPQSFTLPHPDTALVSLRSRLREKLAALGLFEACTTPLEDPARLTLVGAPAQVILDYPASEDMSVLRTSLLPRHLDVIAHNENRQRGRLRFFEFDREYFGLAEHDAREVLVVSASGPQADVRWGIPAQPTDALDFFWLKGLVESLVEGEGLPLASLVWTEGDAKTPALVPLAPGNRAVVTLGGAPFATLGKLHPTLQAKWSLSKPVYWLALDMARLADAVTQATTERTYTPVPRQPSVVRDMSFVVTAATKADELLGTLTGVDAATRALMESVRVTDLYLGAPIPEGMKSLSVSVVFRAADRSLTGDEVAAVEAQLIEAVRARHGAALRQA